MQYIEWYPSHHVYINRSAYLPAHVATAAAAVCCPPARFTELDRRATGHNCRSHSALWPLITPVCPCPTQLVLVFNDANYYSADNDVENISKHQFSGSLRMLCNILIVCYLKDVSSDQNVCRWALKCYATWDEKRYYPNWEHMWQVSVTALFATKWPTCSMLLLILRLCCSAYAPFPLNPAGLIGSFCFVAGAHCV